MSHIISLGAINKETGSYVYPKIANKKDQYICPECKKSLILCQGEIRIHHFRHKNDSIHPCHHYSNPSETQIHKDAKVLLKTLFEKKIPISIERKCCSCTKFEEYEIPEMTDSSEIKLEYRFNFKGLKIADIAYIDNGEIFCIFEIYNTHKTCSENRPEPWFEINAEMLIKIANDVNCDSLKIPCSRYEKCDKCISNDLRIAEEQKRFSELILRIAEQKKAEELRIAEQKKAEELRIAEQKKAEELRIVEEKKRADRKRSEDHTKYFKKLLEQNNRCPSCKINFCKCEVSHFLVSNYNGRQLCSHCGREKCKCVKITNFFKK